METPKITLTMLGAAGSGKTLFLHGMYATLSAGIAGYFVYTRDPDDDVDMMDVWDQLIDEGTVPPPNDQDGQKAYEFAFKKGLDPLLYIDMVDFRGGATEGKRDSADDTREIMDRLDMSDSIYLVLDGGQVAHWVLEVKDLAEGEVATRNRGRDPMRIARLSRLIAKSADARRGRDRPPPSLVLLITKADLIEEITGMPRGEALGVAARNMRSLVPIAYSKGMTTLICPVQIGRLGKSLHAAVNPEDLDPRGLHRPFVFSLWHYLHEGIEAGRARAVDLDNQRSEAEEQIAELRGRFGGALFRRGRISSLEEAVREADDEMVDLQNSVGDAEAQLKELMAELGRLPIIKDGTEWRAVDEEE